MFSHCTPYRRSTSLMRFVLTALWLLLPALFLAGCGGAKAPAATATPAPTATIMPTATPAPTATPVPAPTLLPTPEGATNAIPAYGYTVIDSFPHDVQAYTQGLQYVDGVFYEGTGLEGRSSLRKVDIESDSVLQQHNLEDQYFGEGIAVVGDRIWQLTWKSQVAFLYDRESFKEIKRVEYSTQGWGLTYDGTRLIMSDGTSTLYFRDPESFDEIGRVNVTYQGQPVLQLNELEYIHGEVWANIYQTNFIVRIDPTTGEVVSFVDLAGLLDKETLTSRVDVLNGIAFDEETNRLFVTGKLWPKIYEITLHQMGWAQ